MDLDVGQLKKNHFFSGFTDGEIRKLIKEGNINRVRAGTPVFMQGDLGEAMYILLTVIDRLVITNKKLAAAI